MSQLKTLCVFGTRPEAIKMAPLVLHCLAGRIGDILGLPTIIAQLTKQFQAKQHALFLGRDPHYPIAMEGGLTPKEISYVYVESCAAHDDGEGITHIAMPWVHEAVSRTLRAIPLQLLSYHVALIKGTDVDNPRNPAKLVTVEQGVATPMNNS